MRGKCLCGSIRFELSGVIPNLYQCHCSLCRKVTGSSANAALKVDLAQLNWSRGEDLERCLEALRAQGIVKSHVHVINSNQLGRDFWSRRGWHHRAEIEMYSIINGDNENA